MADAFSSSDIVVAGAGIAGASAALMLKQRLGSLVSVALCDPRLDMVGDADPRTERHSMRAVAVAPDARRMLGDCGVWDAVASEAQPIRSMAITDARPETQPKPVFLTFDGSDQQDGLLAHMIFTEDLRRALLQACQSAHVRFVSAGVFGFKHERHGLTLMLSDGQTARTRLLAAADGGRSRLRHAAGIQSLGHPYGQAAVVATIGHSEPHHGVATQHFLPGGPLALLPLQAADGSPRRVSIVWVDSQAKAAALLKLPDADCLAALRDRIGPALGTLELEDRPSAFPLEFRLARRLTTPRVALLGDAARVIHPLAGQGLNLGLRDAAALAERVAAAAELGIDPGRQEVLDAYERDRRFDATAMAVATDMLNRLFSNDRLPVRLLRDIGLGLVDRMPGLKSRFITQAVAPARPVTDALPPERRSKQPFSKRPA